MKHLFFYRYSFHYRWNSREKNTGGRFILFYEAQLYTDQSKISDYTCLKGCN